MQRDVWVGKQKMLNSLRGIMWPLGLWDNEVMKAQHNKKRKWCHCLPNVRLLELSDMHDWGGGGDLYHIIIRPNMDTWNKTETDRKRNVNGQLLWGRWCFPPTICLWKWERSSVQPPQLRTHPCDPT